jgi:UDP-N-acetyl-D-mannosaminuronate dehydrogenase
VIATAHKMFDYGLVAKHAQTVVDCRNVLKGRRTRGVFRI